MNYQKIKNIDRLDNLVDKARKLAKELDELHSEMIYQCTPEEIRYSVKKDELATAKRIKKITDKQIK